MSLSSALPPFAGAFARIGLCLMLLAADISVSSACTLWAVAGPEANGGTLLAKNRDWRPDHTQTLKRIRPKNGYAFFGLYAQGNDDPGIKAGINEKGLSIVVAASNIPRKLRQAQPGKHGVISTILGKYASVDELLANAEKVFSVARASYYLVSDRREVLMAEIGLDGKFQLTRVKSGPVTHTNHYLGPMLATIYNTKPRDSSTLRLQRINQLLADATRPYSIAQFIDMSRDTQNGPDNSLWRSGKTKTMASWIVETPARGNPRLRVLIANPDEKETVHDYLLDEAFWNR